MSRRNYKRDRRADLALAMALIFGCLALMLIIVWALFALNESLI